MRRLPLLALFFLLVVSQVTALGLSPPDAKLQYEPGKVYQFSVRVINLNDFPIALETRTTGPLNGAIEVQLPTVIPSRGAAEIPVTITLPMERDRPGTEKSYLFFKEAYKGTSAGSFAVRTEVGLTISVWQPYPGYYAEIAASALSVSEGEDTLLRVQISNLGVEDVEDGSATVRVLSANGVTKDTFTYAPVNVAANSNIELNDVISSSLYEPGKYILEAELLYGAAVSRMNGSFIVGKQDIEAYPIEGKFYLDQPVNKFGIPVESLWNLPLDDVFAIFTLGATSTRTPTSALAPFGRDTLTGYWETDTVLLPGTQQATVNLYFPGGQKNYTFPVTVYNETPRVPSQIEEPTIVLTGADIIFAVLAVIIVLCIVLFAMQRHKKQPPELPPSP